MIATINDDCTILTLSADALLAVSGKTIDSLMLKSRLNCSSTESSVDVSSLIGSIVDNQIEIPATLFYGDDTKTTYCDGIYYFNLNTYYYTEADSYLVEDSACVLIGCELKCKVLDYYIETKDRKVWYLYYALIIGSQCDSCYCTEMCSLYSELKILLNDNNISYTADGCGCS